MVGFSSESYGQKFEIGAVVFCGRNLENLRISQQINIGRMGQELIAVETADSGQNSINGVICEGSMDVCHSAFDGGRA